MKTVLIRHERPEWTDWYVERMRGEFPGFAFVGAHTLDEAMAAAPEAQVYVCIGPQTPPALIAAMPRLEWLQSLSTGVDSLLAMPDFPAHVPISRVTGVHGPQMAELALMLMLALARDLPAMLAAQSRGAWDRRPQPLLYGKTLCLLGLGSIAERLAQSAAALGMRVTGISDGRTSAPHVDRIWPRADLAEAAADADFLTVLVPLSPETRHIVDASVLAAMKPTAFLINIARGGCVDEAALIEALETGQIAGAGVDVFETEPLPPASPLWSAPNLIITPHVGGYSDVYHEQCYPTLAENFRAYAAGGAGAVKNTVPR